MDATLPGNSIIDRLDRSLAALGRLVDEARAWGGSVSATDPSVAIRVVLAADGLPERIEADPDWRRKVGVDGFAAAVTAACETAALARLDAIGSAAEDHRWIDRFGELTGYIGGTGPAPDGLPPAAAAARAEGAEPFWTSQHTEQQLAADESARRHAAHRVAGSGARGRLTLTLGPLDSVSCAADPDWLARSEPAGVASALGDAVASLRTERDAARAAERGALTTYSALVAEARAHAARGHERR